MSVFAAKNKTFVFIDINDIVLILIISLDDSCKVHISC